MPRTNGEEPFVDGGCGFLQAATLTYSWRRAQGEGGWKQHYIPMTDRKDLDMREEAANWLAQAERDLKTARHLRESRDYYASVFFSHQACEKALKAAHMELNKRRMHTHNLVRLAGELHIQEGLLGELRDLSPEYVTTRYPDAAEGPTEDLYDEGKALHSLRTAEKVVSWTKKQLKQ